MLEAFRSLDAVLRRGMIGTVFFPSGYGRAWHDLLDVCKIPSVCVDMARASVVERFIISCVYCLV